VCAVADVVSSPVTVESVVHLYALSCTLKSLGVSAWIVANVPPRSPLPEYICKVAQRRRASEITSRAIAIVRRSSADRTVFPW